MARILTDYHDVMQELRKPYSDHATAKIITYSLLHISTIGVTILLAWTPGHTDFQSGNQAAHDTARESTSFKFLTSLLFCRRALYELTPGTG